MAVRPDRDAASSEIFRPLARLLLHLADKLRAEREGAAKPAARPAASSSRRPRRRA
jgi:hypothetical protein